MSAEEPGPEVKAILGDYVRAQREKYGEDWKAKKAAEMAAEMSPTLNALFDALMRKKA